MSELSSSTTSATTRFAVSPMFWVALANVFFVGSMLLWMTFLWNGALNLVPLDDRLNNEVAKLGLDGALCMAFFVQHSTMIRRPFRRFLAQWVATEYHGVVYTVTSGAVLSMVVVVWQKSAYVVVTPSLVVRWFLRAMFLLALPGLRWAAQSLKQFDVCGVDPMLIQMGRKKKEPPQPMPLSTNGFYRHVRHPFYCCCLVLFWSCPNLTLDRLLYNVLWSLWVVMGTWLEERDLVMDFGEPYRDYQRQVPMLIPWRMIWSEKKTQAKPMALEKKSA